MAVFKNKIDFLISILNEFNLLDFSIMMPEEIQQSKINIVNLKRQIIIDKKLKIWYNISLIL